MFVTTELARIPLDNFKRVNNSICKILETIWEMDMHQAGQQTTLVWIYNKIWSAENEKCVVFCYHSFLYRHAQNRWSNLVQSSPPLSAWSTQGHSWHTNKVPKWMHSSSTALSAAVSPGLTVPDVFCQYNLWQRCSALEKVAKNAHIPATDQQQQLEISKMVVVSLLTMLVIPRKFHLY